METQMNMGAQVVESNRPCWTSGRISLWIRNAGVLLLAMLAPCIVSAQVETARIVGTVHDGSGAVITGAVLTVVNTETNISH